MRPVFSVKGKAGNKDDKLKSYDDEKIDYGKLMCYQLAEYDINNFEKLYKEYKASEVVELLSFMLANQ